MSEAWRVTKYFLMVFDLVLLMTTSGIFIFLLKQYLAQRKQNLKKFGDPRNWVSDQSSEQSLELLCFVALVSTLIVAFTTFLIFGSGVYRT